MLKYCNRKKQSKTKNTSFVAISLVKSTKNTKDGSLRGINVFFHQHAQSLLSDYKWNANVFNVLWWRRYGCIGFLKSLRSVFIYIWPSIPAFWELGVIKYYCQVAKLLETLGNIVRQWTRERILPHIFQQATFQSASVQQEIIVINYQESSKYAYLHIAISLSVWLLMVMDR